MRRVTVMGQRRRLARKVLLCLGLHRLLPFRASVARTPLPLSPRRPWHCVEFHERARVRAITRPCRSWRPADEIQCTTSMKLAQCADALHVARRCRIGASNFTRIEVKIGHSALQEMCRIRTAFRRGAELGSRHAHIPRHPLHVRFAAECKVGRAIGFDAVSAPLQHGRK